MTELDSTQNAKVFSEEEIADLVTTTVNAAAQLRPGMDATKHLASVYAVYYDETGKSWPPSEVVNLELLRAVGVLETRILALENALDKAGIERPKVSRLDGQ